MKSPARVHVVDDDAAIREALCALLDSVSIEAQAHASAKDFLAIASPGMDGCLVTDVRMPGMSGLELLQAMNDRGILIPVIVITGHGDVPMAVRAMKAGAVEFLLKPFNEQDLLDRILDSLQSHDQNNHRARLREQAASRFDDLTPREWEVLAQIMDCQHSKGIAHSLGISEKTVDVHRFNIMRKTGVRNLPELIQLRLQAGDGLDAPA